MRNKIFFDLDGTLIDSKQRLFELFQHLVPESELNFNQYWDLKKSKKSHSEILSSYYSYSEDFIVEFTRKWMLLIEAPVWLKYDVPFEGVSAFLNEVKVDYDLYLITARQNKNKAIVQVDSFGWECIFEEILVTEQKYEKAELIASSCSTLPDDWLIGDTGKDILAGKELGIRTGAVTSGFMNEKTLLDYNPDIFFETVINFNK